jgi:hypothetical protein
MFDVSNKNNAIIMKLESSRISQNTNFPLLAYPNETKQWYCLYGECGCNEQHHSIKTPLANKTRPHPQNVTRVRKL